MIQDLHTIVEQAQGAIKSAKNLEDLDAVRIKYLGKQGELTSQLKSLSQLSPEERPKLGQAVNEAKQSLIASINTQTDHFKDLILNAKLATEKIDVTLPGRHTDQGSFHPVTRVLNRIVSIFERIGFTVVEGPEVEDDFHNFTALNIPEKHPARAMHDTFYFPDGRVLRTHTSPVQIRAMKNTKPPLSIITPGKAFRCDLDPTHTPMFHQLEVLHVAKDTTMAELKGILSYFLNAYFEQEVPMRLRPSYFPFTEPSAEVDIQCVLCAGEGCRVCSHTGWLEVLGCGMVHPNVLRNVDIDPDEFRGFAFGIGLDRLAMLRYGIDDLRQMFINDVRFLEQF